MSAGLQGEAALALFFDIAPEAAEELERWYSQEHFPERLGVPGFLRGTRFRAVDGGPCCFALYEVADLGVLTGAAYRRRLDNPTPWTQRIMKSFRNMVRGFCAVRASFGRGLGDALLTVRYVPPAENARALDEWLRRSAETLSHNTGIVGVHLLEPAAKPQMTREQAVRGKDADMPALILVSGTEAALAAAREDLSPEKLTAHGASAVLVHVYRIQETLAAREVL